MNKKALKIVTASTVVVSAFVATNPALAKANSSVEVLVSYAKAQMKEAYYTYSHTITEDEDFPDIDVVRAEYAKAKKMYADAKAVVQKEGGKKKDAYLADLDATYKTYITQRVIPYIDAYKMFETIELAYDDLWMAESIEETNVTYIALSKLLTDSRLSIINRVYGKTTRDLFKEEISYIKEARDEYKYDVTVYQKLELAKTAIAVNDFTTAKAALNKVNEFLPKTDEDLFKGELTDSYYEVKSAYEGKTTAHVLSVTVVDRKQLVVTFTQELDVASATNTANYKLNGIQPATAVLNDDKKSVTLTFASSIEGDDLAFVVEPIATAVQDNKGVVIKTERYTQVVSFTDTVAPEVTSATVVGQNTVKLVFSEELGTNKLITGDIKLQKDEATFVNGVGNVGLTIALDPADATHKTYIVTIDLDTADEETDAIFVDENTSEAYTIVLDVGKVNDVSGNVNAAYTTEVTFTK